MNYFNNLPPELIENIFEKLNFNDLINVRIVDKRFKLICEEIKLKQLIITNEYQYSKLWFYTNEIIHANEDQKILIEQFLNYILIFKLDHHLKRLCICLNKNFNLNLLNIFRSLEQLDINVCTNLAKNYKLSLDNLKIAEIHFEIENNEFRLTFDTIKLFALKSNNELNNNFIFNYPKNIIYFESDFYDDIAKFSNLEYLKYSSENRIDRNILIKFKNLIILDLNLDLCDCLEEDFMNIKSDINYLIDQKDVLKRSNFKIYFNGVKLVNKDKIYELRMPSNYIYNYDDVCKYKILEFQIKNYDLLKDKNCYVYNDINYCYLIKLIKIIPKCFIDKFSRINIVTANDHIDNEDEFIKFLNKLPFLTILELKNCGLTRSFYDKLIESVYLYNLKMLQIEEQFDLTINIDFILNLKYLKTFLYKSKDKQYGFSL